MSPRYPAFDSLRAVMMLLGLALHAALSYITRPVPDWVIRDQSRHLFFDLLVAWTHAFRMPVFFVVAGFFAHLLLECGGPAAFARNRARRIGLVLLLSWFPLFASLFVLVETARHPNDPAAFQQAVAALATPQFWGKLQLAHLWFLYYLLLCCGAVLALYPFRERLAGGGTWLAGRTAAALRHPWRAAPLLAVPLAALLATMQMGFLATPHYIWPIHGGVLAAYLLFFGFGWFLYACRDQLWQLRAPANRLLLAGTGVVLASLPFLQFHLPRVTAIGIAWGTWLLVFGMLGFFTRYANRESTWMRYLSDASYFVYLAHLPVVFAGTIALQPLGWPAAAKFMVVVTVSFGLLLGAYELLVRHTWIGTLLSPRARATNRVPYAAAVSEPYAR
ncbi:MAG: acyltransferase family protein [Bryobacterales bacterium]|nr:acyltransferase family protein [Bryobacterales bacterium]